MDKKLIVLGILIGFICTIIGASVYLAIFTKFSLFSDFDVLIAEHILGKVVALGSVLNLIVFLIFIKLNKELVARGVVLATLLIAIATIFV